MMTKRKEQMSVSPPDAARTSGSPLTVSSSPDELSRRDAATAPAVIATTEGDSGSTNGITVNDASSLNAAGVSQSAEGATVPNAGDSGSTNGITVNDASSLNAADVSQSAEGAVTNAAEIKLLKYAEMQREQLDFLGSLMGFLSDAKDKLRDRGVVVSNTMAQLPSIHPSVILVGLLWKFVTTSCPTLTSFPCERPLPSVEVMQREVEQCVVDVIEDSKNFAYHAVGTSDKDGGERDLHNDIATKTLRGAGNRICVCCGLQNDNGTLKNSDGGPAAAHLQSLYSGDTFLLRTCSTCNNWRNTGKIGWFRFCVRDMEKELLQFPQMCPFLVAVPIQKTNEDLVAKFARCGGYDTQWDFANPRVRMLRNGTVSGRKNIGDLCIEFEEVAPPMVLSSLNGLDYRVIQGMCNNGGAITQKNRFGNIETYCQELMWMQTMDKDVKVQLWKACWERGEQCKEKMLGKIRQLLLLEPSLFHQEKNVRSPPHSTSGHAAPESNQKNQPQAKGDSFDTPQTNGQGKVYSTSAEESGLPPPPPQTTSGSEKLNLEGLRPLHYRILWGLCENSGVYFSPTQRRSYDATDILKKGWITCKRTGEGCKEAMIKAISEAATAQRG